MTTAPTFSSPAEAAAAAREARVAGDVATAIAIYRNLPEAFPGKESVAQAASGLRACGRWSEGVALLEEALVANPVSTGLIAALADAYMEKGQWDQAIACVEGFLQQTPAAGMWANLGNIKSLAGDWIGAEQAYRQELTLNPLNIEAVLGHGDALYRLGYSDEVVAAYRRAVALKPQDARGHFKLGTILLARATVREAKAALFRAIELDPANADAHANLAALYHQSYCLQRAVQSARQAIDLNPELVPAYLTLGAVLLEAGETAGAAGILRIAADLEPGSVTVLSALATAENAAGNPRDAERALQRILAIEPDNLEARHMLAAVNGEPVKTVPPGYCRQFFNWHGSQWNAVKYDRLLAGSLGYKAPEAAAALLAETRPDPKSFARFLDLGCGTGLVLAALAKRYAFDREIGVDVAENMIEVCRGKGLYDDLIHGDAGEVLAANPGSFNLITAVDLFTYVGELRTLMPQIADALASGGILAYAIELLPEGKYKLQRSGRFAHAQKYVEDLAQAAGLVPLTSRAAPLRLESGVAVAGLVGLLQRP